MTQLHFVTFLGQHIDDASRQIPLERALDAIEIAQKLGYETSSERLEMIDCVCRRSTCKYGIQWQQCEQGACSCQCGSGPKSAKPVLRNAQ